MSRPRTIDNLGELSEITNNNGSGNLSNETLASITTVIEDETIAKIVSGEIDLTAILNRLFLLEEFVRIHFDPDS